MKTVLHVKIDADVKKDVQALAKRVEQAVQDVANNKNLSPTFTTVDDAVAWLNK